jgi:hypothetical protein
MIKTTEKDIESVAKWLNIHTDDLIIEIKDESIEKFKNSIEEMISSYKNFPKELARTQKIIKAIKKGEVPLPVYVEKNDDFNFILEGRHRIVAFFNLGFSSIKVARVSKKLKL